MRTRKSWKVGGEKGGVNARLDRPLTRRRTSWTEGQSEAGGRPKLRRRSCAPVAKMAFPKYKPSGLATLPSTLNPAEYDISPEARQAQAERLAIRARLKREYLLQYNNPKRRGLIVSRGPSGREWRGLEPDWLRGTRFGATPLPQQHPRGGP